MNLSTKKIPTLFVRFLITFVNNITLILNLYKHLRYYIYTLRYYKYVYIFINLHIKIFEEKLLFLFLFSFAFSLCRMIAFPFCTTRFDIAIHFSARYCKKSSDFSIEFHFKFAVACQNSILFDASRGFYAVGIEDEILENRRTKFIFCQ